MGTPRRRVFVISYDVSDDRRRDRLRAFLETMGRRVQYSVFELIASDDLIRSVLEGATEPERFDLGTDSLRCYPLCGRCFARADVRGTAEPPVGPGTPLVV